MRTSFNYFIVYYFEKDKRTGVGNCGVVRDCELDNPDSIRELEEDIAKKHNFNHVLILNWKLLK